MKQSDIDTRIATAHLIDEMSLGVTLIPESERVATELAHFLYSQRTPESLYPLTWLVWSKLSYVLGVFRPTNTGLPPHVELAFQKAGFDHFWDVTLAEMIDLISHNTRPPTVNFAALAQKLNESNRAHAKEIRSFAEAYVNEIAGALSLVTPTAMDIVEEMYQRDTDRTVHSSREERNLYEEQWCTILTNAFRFRKDTMARILPTLHVIASCHAVFRWDKQRQFEANDFIDFHHAAAALAYCDAFLTERSLQVLVSSNPLALDKLLDCRVISALPEAVSYLQDLP